MYKSQNNLVIIVKISFQHFKLYQLVKKNSQINFKLKHWWQAIVSSIQIFVTIMLKTFIHFLQKKTLNNLFCGNLFIYIIDLNINLSTDLFIYIIFWILVDQHFNISHVFLFHWFSFVYIVLFSNYCM